MKRADHLLDILAEECSEVAVQCSKALRFGLEDCEPGQPMTNARRIMEELRDAIEMAHMLEEEGHITGAWRDRKPQKRAKVERFLARSRELGRLEP